MSDVRESVEIPAGSASLEGELAVPAGAGGLVLFAHGSGSGRHSPRNARVARTLHDHGLATLLFDLLTDEEARVRDNVFDVPLLGDRLLIATAWAADRPDLASRPVGYFGASTGAAAALVAAASMGERIGAVVARGGRPDLADARLSEVSAPTLLIVGGRDVDVLELNRRALASLGGDGHEFAVVPEAGHLFEEAGALDEVARLAAAWFTRHLGAAA